MRNNSVLVDDLSLVCCTAARRYTMKGIGNAARKIEALIASALRRHAVLLIVFTLLQIGDIVSTHLALRGGHQEGNPIPAVMLASTGEFGMYALKVVSVVAFLIVACLLESRLRRVWQAVYVMNVVMLVVVVSNAMHIL